MNPLISIIVPVYKVEEYLDMCVQSIVDQTYSNLEIILVDDGSPDQCPAMCDEWAKKNPRIKVIHQKNAGAAAARNAALDIAKGDYIGFVDSDDYIDSDMFEKLLLALEGTEKKASCCVARSVMLDGSTQPMTEVCAREEMDEAKTIKGIFLNTIDSAVWSKLFERSVFDHIRFPEGEVNEEFPILIPLVMRAKGMVHTGKTLYNYRSRPGSVTSPNGQIIKNSKTVYKNLLLMKQQLQEYGLPCEKEYRIFAAKCALSCSLIMEKRYKQISEAMRKDYQVFRSIMKENFFAFVCSSKVRIKDKVLYVLVWTRLLRPVYSIFYKNHL